MRRLALIAPLALISAAVAGEPGFWMVHTPGDPMDGRVRGLSQNGLVAVGYTVSPDHVGGCWWTAATGRYDYGEERGMPSLSAARAVSSDGGKIVGSMGEWNYEQSYWMEHAYRRVGNGPLQDLGQVGNWPITSPSGVSGDGLIVVGTCKTSEYLSRAFGEPFRWTAETGMVGLGHLKPKSGSYTRGFGISRDGTTIVGTSRYGTSGPTEAYRWTAQTGMVQLPSLRGIPTDDYGAQAVNADGSVIVGYVAQNDGYPYENYAVRWVDGRIEDLGTFGPGGGGRMSAVDDSGSVIGGEYAAWATIWTPATGLMKLHDYLARFGLKAPEGLTLAFVSCISGDGLTIGGWAHDKSNHSYGFVATIPAPCDADCDQSGQLDIDDFICFQTLFGLGDAAADCDKSGGLDFDDFTCFSAAFAAGCP